LEHLHEQGAKTIATTHYGELKAFAYTRPGVQNACVEFDIVTLKPTYRLLTGLPGSSNAFAISQRLGLSTQLVERARALVGGEHQHFESVLSAMEAQKKAGERDRAESAALRGEAERLRQALQKEKESLEAKKREIIGKARGQADEILRDARHEVEEIIAELKKQFAGKGGAGVQSAVDQARRKLRERIAEVNPLDADREGLVFQDDATPVVGDTVFVRSIGQQGVVESADDNSFSVRFGSMKTVVPKEQCVVVAGKGKEKGQRQRADGGGLNVAKVQSVSREIDIRGTNNDEAQYILEKYIDDAVLAGLDSVIVIHGKGTGALKKGVRAFLKEHPRVKNVSIAEQNQGGDGASVVKLK
jgi:DNA mismatch repair protein MutS2